LFGRLLYRAPFCVFFIETDPTRHIVLCLVFNSPRSGETQLGSEQNFVCD
jgi:hypothetical protein